MKGRVRALPSKYFDLSGIPKGYKKQTTRKIEKKNDTFQKNV